MTYTQILRKVAVATEYPLPICRVVVDTFFQEAAKGLAKDGKVSLTGLMTMEVYDRKGCTRFDPNLRVVRFIDSTKNIRCTVSRKFKDIAYGKVVVDEDA